MNEQPERLECCGTVTPDDLEWLELKLTHAEAISRIGAEAEAEAESAADRFYGRLDHESGVAEATRLRRILYTLRQFRAVEEALAAGGVAGIYDEFADPADAVRQTASHIRMLEGEREAEAREEYGEMLMRWLRHDPGCAVSLRESVLCWPVMLQDHGADHDVCNCGLTEALRQRTTKGPLTAAPQGHPPTGATPPAEPATARPTPG